MVLMVKAPAMVTAPLSLEVPRTAKVVEGEAVPMPTFPSLALTTKVLVPEVSPQVKVEVAEGETAEKAPVTRRVESMVEEAYTKIPAEVLVGARVLEKS